MGLTTHAFMTYTPPSHPGIMHLMPIGDGDGYVMVGDIESLASQFAESVSHCSQEKHGGRGRTHTSDEIQNAFMSGVHQLMETDFEEEWRQEEWKRYMHRLWNGGVRTHRDQIFRPVPEGIIMPTESADQWDLVMPSRLDGRPVIHRLRKEAEKMIKEIMPGPGEKADLGFHIKEK